LTLAIESPLCHDLAKWLSHYLYLLFFWTYYIGKSAGKYHITSVTVIWNEKSHDECGKVVYRPCSSCISSVENLIGTPLSSPCQLRLRG